MASKITIVSSAPLTEPVVRNRLFPFFETFMQQGYRVRCVCPRSDFPSEQLPEGVLLEQVDIELAKPNSFIKRAVKEARDVAVLLKRAKVLHDEQVLVTLPSMFLAFLSPFYLRRQMALIDVRDLSWEYLSDASLVQRLAKRVFRYWFKRSVGFFQLVAATNETEMDYLRGISNRLDLIHVSNGIRRQQFDQLKQTRCSEGGPFTVAYIGNIGLAQQLDTLVKAAAHLPSIRFNIVGSGIDEPRVRALLQELRLNNVEMTGRVTWEQVLQYYDSAHVLYAQLAPDFSGAMPSKLYEYLSTGKIIVYGGIGQAVETLGQFESCHVVPPCDPEALAEKLVALQERKTELTLSTANQTAIEKKYIRENAAKALAEKIDQLRVQRS